MKIDIKEDLVLEGTGIILEKGDSILIEDSPYIPETKLIVPEDIDLPGFKTGMINKGSEVRFETYDLRDCFLVVLYYNQMKFRPYDYIKIPLIFTSEADAITKGYLVNNNEPFVPKFNLGF